MRKTTRRIASAKSLDRRVLKLSQETVRMLSSDELTHAVSGCLTGTRPTTQQDSGATCLDCDRA